jgi:tRNA-specific 2-thiouridylase
MEPVLPGNFVNRSGKVLGTHGGIPFYTVGQRRGLGLSGAEPLYVVALRPHGNEVVLGPEPELFGTELRVGGANWVSCPPIAAPIEAEVKIRYSHEGARARIVPEKQAGGEDTLRVEFKTPVRAIAPGQAAVFYQGDVVLGGGWILPAETF